MTDWWTRTVANIGDWFPGGLGMLGLCLFLLGVLIGVLLQPGLYQRWFRWEKGKKKLKPAEPIVVTAEADDEALPDMPSDALLARAQQLMGAGHYKEAVREWLRLMVRELVERNVIENHPGWTVTELATAAGDAVPPASGMLTEAARIFSDAWYGGYEMHLDQAARMRDIRTEVIAYAGIVHESATVFMEAP
ncbi:MAG TPA: DUF4129 domain-containing protein [Candidatus Stackebrandtia faecavium]|nr:DUF4129 domain-containing protein [Candidatus Stackebrandtia faecavium]